AGFSRICLVISPGDVAIRARYSTQLRLERLEIAFAQQATARGTADALLAARDFAGDDEFLVLNADNYYPVAGLEWLRDSGEPATLAFARGGLLRSGQIEADRLARYALLDVGADGYLRDVVEKPDAELVRAPARCAFARCRSMQRCSICRTARTSRPSTPRFARSRCVSDAHCRRASRRRPERARDCSQDGFVRARVGRAGGPRRRPVGLFSRLGPRPYRVSRKAH